MRDFNEFFPEFKKYMVSEKQRNPRLPWGGLRSDTPAHIKEEYRKYVKENYGITVTFQENKDTIIYLDPK